MTDLKAMETYRFCLNLVRSLMIHNPPFAEYQFQLLKNSLALDEDITKGNWIITHDHVDDTKSYIIVRDGQPLTTDCIPQWACDYPQKHVAADAAADPQEFLNLLRGLLPQFKEAYRPIYVFLSDLVSSAAHYYNNPMTSLAEAQAITDLYNLALRSADTYSNVLLQAQRNLVSSYDAMKIPGDAAIMPLCIITFLRQFQNKQLEENLPDTIATFVRFPQQNFLRNTQAAVLAAQSLYHIADALKESAQKQYTFFQFYNYLYEALLFYRSALYIGNLLISHGIIDNGLEHLVYMSEEMRVIIWLSILPVYRNKTPLFLMPENIFAWLGVLADIPPQNESAPTPHLIHNFYSSLCYPKIYRDLALEIFKISRKMTVHTRKLEKYIRQMEENQNELHDEIDVIDFLHRYVKDITALIKK